jgi:hypothetical protein
LLDSAFASPTHPVAPLLLAKPLLVWRALRQVLEFQSFSTYLVAREMLLETPQPHLAAQAVCNQPRRLVLAVLNLVVLLAPEMQLLDQQVLQVHHSQAAVHNLLFF